MILVYQSSASGFTEKFVNKLPYTNVKIPVNPDEARRLTLDQPFVLATPTYGGGSPSRKGKTYIPKNVTAFLENPENSSKMVATTGSGQDNFGVFWFCRAPKDIAEKYDVPFLGGFNLSGLPGEDEEILEEIRKIENGK